MGKIIALAAGKGGTGKTLLTAALGERLAARAPQVCLLDACAGLRGLDLSLGLQDQGVFDWLDLSREDCTMEQALLRGVGESLPCLIAAPQDLLPEDVDIVQLQKLLTRLQKRFDYVLIDTPSGIGSLTRSLCAMADETVLITTMDFAAQRGTERLSALLREAQPEAIISLIVIVNRLLPAKRRQDDPEAAAAALSGYLDLPLYAAIRMDDTIGSVDARKAAAQAARSPQWLIALDQAADRLCGSDTPLKQDRVRRKLWLSRIKG